MSLKIECAGASPGKARFVTRSQTLRLTKGTAWRNLWRSRVCARFESAIRPTVRTIPRSPKDDDQHRYQDHEQVVKIELKCGLKPLKVDELIDQGHPLFIGKFLGREARQKHDELVNRLQYIEKHLEPPLISASYQSVCGGCRPPCSSGCMACGAIRELKDCHIHIGGGFGAGCGAC